MLDLAIEALEGGMTLEEVLQEYDLIGYEVEELVKRESDMQYE